VPSTFPDQDELPATNFWPGSPCVDWADLRALAEGGHEVASHAATHVDLSKAPDEVLEDEVVGSRRVFAERLGARVGGTFVYPFGKTDARVAPLVRANYACARATAMELNPTDPEDLYATAGALVHAAMKAGQLDRWVQAAIAHGAWMVEVYHLIVPDADKAWEERYDWCWSTSRFGEHLAAVADVAGDLWIATHERVAAYVRQRQGTQVALGDPAEGALEVTVTPGAVEGDLELEPVALRVSGAAGIRTSEPPLRAEARQDGDDWIVQVDPAQATRLTVAIG
jgi:hypothetical protein